MLALPNREDTTRSLTHGQPGFAAGGSEGAYLVVVAEGRPLARPRVVALAPGITVLGRQSHAPAAELLLDDSSVSKAHLAIEVSPHGLALEDRESKNGTWIDGARVVARTIAGDGAVIRLGESIVVLRSGVPPSLAALDDPELPGLAPALGRARQHIAEVARSAAPVLVLGETGTGKDLAARAVHRLSGRAGSFCAANAAELRGGLAASELFGRVKGAFTDAQEGHGLVDAARDGTLFLDEIGDMSVEVQAMLLRFVENGRYRPVGSPAELASSARVVAATNVDLDAAVADGRFRRDLLGRLRGHFRPIQLPPLRERPEDLVLWAERLGGPAALDDWSAPQLERLLLTPWREGLRELRRAVNDGPHSLPDAPRSLPDAPRPVLPTAELLTSALAATAGNVRAAAERLGVDRRRLYRLMEEHAIDLSRFRGGD